MNLNIEWQKIVINAMSVFVAAIILGAAGIVWERAMSVDGKIREAETKHITLLGDLTEKLGKYEVQLTTMSNQLSVLINNQTLLISKAQSGGFAPLAGLSNPLTTFSSDFIPPKSTIPDQKSIDIQQKAATGDMLRQFTLPRK